MTAQDINSHRPRYLNRQHQLDWYWSVWNTKTNEQVMLFVCDKGTKRGYFTGNYDETKQEIYCWQEYVNCTYALGELSKAPWTILDDAAKAGIPPGNYKCSITRPNGERLVSYEFTI